MRRLKEAAEVGVYRINAPSAFMPSFSVPFGEAMRMVEEGSAVTINKGTAIRIVMVERHAQYEYSCSNCFAERLLSPIAALEIDGPVNCLKCEMPMARKDDSANASERPWNMRDRSLKISGNKAGRMGVMEQFVAGSEHAESLVRGWAENHAGLGALPAPVGAA
ncbi:MAG: hypothetical protein M3P27_03005 [Acidobacteriota bacterium]|nr:hypothetical protein [Acidobacteriota bacterium]